MMIKKFCIFAVLMLAVALPVKSQVLGDASLLAGRDVEFSSIEVGVSFANLTPRSSNTSTLFRFDYNQPFFAAALRQENYLVLFNYSKFNISGTSVSSLNLAAKFDFDVLLGRNENLSVVLPFSFLTDYTAIDAGVLKVTDDLQVSSLSIGTGLGAVYKTKHFLASLKTQAYIGFSNQGFSAASGYTTIVYIDATAELPRLFGSIGFAATYRLGVQSWNISVDNDKYNYTATYNTLTAGITF
jgi:hypothetical protein